MAGLSLSLLGPFSAAVDQQELSRFRTRLAQALLIYLVCQPERHSREQLMALLWPDLSQTAAQQNLRQNLYYLRKAIPEVAAGNGHTLVPLLLTDYHTVQLNPQAAVQLDVRQFSTLIEEGWTDQQQLAQAVALYRGDFLVDFYLPDSNPFEEWAAARRESYRRQLLTALERLAAHALTAADYPAAESYARQQLAIDPLHEASNRQLIEILARSGRRSAALAHYDEYQRLLKTELGVEPGSETLTLLKAVQTGELHPAEPTEPTSQRPGHIRSYQLQEELGRGSFGVVYRALQPAIGRHVAIKVIPAQFADDPTFIRRFESEAQFIARLEHAQIVPLYDYWREPGSAYLVMRYLRGGNLKAALQKGAWSLAQVAQFLQQVAAALHTAHRNGIVHRDVKPANILLDEAGNAYLSDFGIAKLFQAEEATRQAETLTGTPEYLSPEQINNYPTTPLSDQYSLGVVVYELLNGRPPFAADSIRLLLEKHIYEPLPLISQQNPDVPAAIDEVLQRATAKTPEARFPDIAAFADAFAAAFHTTQDEPLLTDHPVPLLNVTNPYQGLLPFTEADAALFFGRDTLIQHLLPRLTSDGQHLPPPHPVIPRFLAIIGPSGSGKSSLVKAGLVPALRGGAIPGSESWFILDIIPGSHPFEELETALLRIAVNPPTSLLEQLQADQRGLLRTVRRVLPAAENSQLLLIIDQFEELFTLVSDRTVTARFLDALYTAITDPRSPLRVIITLRADFYDRPLLYPGISELLQHHTEIVIPLTADELVQAIERPASLVGAYVEPELVAALVADVNQQPGALPLLQHTLSELFEQRQENRLLLSTYRQLGGISGALAQRAEAVFDQLDQAGQAAARNLFLRLVTLGEGVEDTRRRVLQAELLALDVIGETRRLRDWETPQSTILEPQGEREQGSEGAEKRGKTVNGQWLTVNGEWEGSPNLSVSQSPNL